MIKKYMFLLCCFANTTIIPSSQDRLTTFDKIFDQKHTDVLQKLRQIITPKNFDKKLKEIPSMSSFIETYYGGLTPFAYAIKIAHSMKRLPHDYDEIVDHLFKQGVRPEDYSSAMASHAIANDYNMVIKLINRLSINDTFFWINSSSSPELNKLTPKMFTLLVEHGADLNITLKTTKNILSQINNPLTAQCLLDLGANILLAPDALQRFKAYPDPSSQQIVTIFDALKDPKDVDPSRMNHDTQCLQQAYYQFQSGNHVPLQQMLIATPWDLSEIIGIDFPIEQMAIACQRVFKKESIVPLIRYLAFDPKFDLKTRRTYTKLIEKYKYHLGLDKKSITPETINVPVSQPISQLQSQSTSKAPRTIISCLTSFVHRQCCIIS